jgi:hypothetical protein
MTNVAKQCLDAKPTEIFFQTGLMDLKFKPLRRSIAWDWGGNHLRTPADDFSGHGRTSKRLC